MHTLPETILQQARSLPEGGVLSPKELLHLGSWSAVDQAFSRLAKAGKLLRMAHGTYAAPVSSRFGSRAPAPEKIVKALTKQSSEIQARAHGSAGQVRTSLDVSAGHTLASARSTLLGWMAQAIGKEAAHG